MYTILLVTHTLLVLFLIFMVLVQRTDSDGLGGLGGGGNQFLTGRGAASLSTRTTAILAAGFMITSLILATMVSRQTETSIVDQIQQETGAEQPAAPAAPKPAAVPAVPKPE